MIAEEYSKQFDTMYGDHKPNLFLSKAKEAALKAYSHYTAESLDDVSKTRKFFAKDYEQAEKDILSKITPEHIAGLKWIGNAGISSQPYPYHKYCKDLLKILEELLNNE